jgi:protein-tyrosine-phosphatase
MSTENVKQIVKEKYGQAALRVASGDGNLLTVCDNAKETCPVFPGHLNRIHKGFEDPAALQGTEEERLSLFRRVRDEIRDYLKVFPS